MADFSALKTAIQTYIKQNGNEEITGDILQEILLSIVTTLGDSAINDLVTALANEVAARQNADGTLQQNISNEATARGNADTALGGRIDDEATARANGDTALSNRLGSSITAQNTAADQIGEEAEARAAADTALQGLIDGITDNIENGYVYAGIATPSSTPVTGKVFYLALTAGTYTNFGSTVVSQGINILKYNGSAWSLDAFIGIDDIPTPNSNKLAKSGGVFDKVMTDGSAFDISAHFASGGTLATYADLSAALTALNTLSADYKRGGMSIKYVQTSDNKYVQFRCMAQNFTTDVSQWQGVDDEPIVGSENLVKSNGVINYLKSVYGNIVEGYAIISGVQTSQSGFMITLNIPVEEGDSVEYKGGFYGGQGGELVAGGIAAYQSNGTNVDYWISSDNARTITIPANTSYIVATFKIGSDYILKVNNVDVVVNSIINTVNSNKTYISILNAKIKKIDNITVLDKSILSTQGYYNIANGVFYSTTQNYYCTKVERGDVQSIIIKSNYNNYGYEGVVFLDSLNNYITGYQIPSTYKLIQVPDNCGYICYSFVPEDGFNAFVYNYKIYSDDSAAAAFVKSSKENSNINFVNGERYEVTGNVGDTATISKESSQTTSSAMINVNVGDVYVITAQGSAAIKPYTLLDSLDVIQETSAGGEIIYQKYVYVKKNGRLIINSLNAYDGVTIPKDIKKYSNPLLQSKLQGKRIALFGDSITAMVDSNGKGIAEYIEEITGANVLRCGIGGLALQDRGSYVPDPATITARLQCYCHLDYANSIPKIVEGDMTDINTVWSMLKTTFGETPTPQEELAMQNWNSIDFDNIDIVIMSAGTNGFKSKVGNDNGNIGTDDSDTIYTYKGAVNIIVESLLTAYPHLSIFFFTPIVRNVSLGTTPTTYEWSDDYVANTEHEPTLDPAFASGVSLPTVCDAIKDICTKNHVSVCDMYNTMSWTRYNFASYSDDGTHPIRGFREMAEKYSAFIISNLNR